MFTEHLEQKAFFNHQARETAEKKFQNAVHGCCLNESLTMSLAGGLKCSQMVYFPTERKCVVARLLLLVFSEIKSPRRCALFESA